MKYVSYGVVSMMVLILFIGMFLTIQGRSIRQQEVSESLDEAMKNTMEDLLSDQIYAIKDKDEFIADFLEQLLIQINSDSTITVNILGADEKKGMLSVEVIETYRHVNGRTGQVSAYRTVILDKKIENEK